MSGYLSTIRINKAACALGRDTQIAYISKPPEYAFHVHQHLAQLERIGPTTERMDVLARQRIDPTAPPHPFTQGGRSSFDALLQSRPDAFAGKLLVCDTTMFSSTAGGIENLRHFWANVIQRPERR